MPRMKDPYYDITIGVVANFIFLGLTIAIGYSGYLLLTRRRLLRFFDITQSKKLVIYLSHIRVVSGGSVGAGDALRQFAGSTVTLAESQFAGYLKGLFFYFIPGLAEQPGILRYLTVTDLDIQILPSPLDRAQIQTDCTIITFGTPGYNEVSGWAQDTLAPGVRCSTANGAIEFIGLAPITDPRKAFVQRLHDAANNRFVFYVAGLSEHGTCGAALFLGSSWSKLQRKYGRDRRFSTAIDVTSVDPLRVRLAFDRAL
ncbi:MAG TPA: hypothetical protein VIS99_08950 [Terrimicrobiaceae bacterium]